MGNHLPPEAVSSFVLDAIGNTLTNPACGVAFFRRPAGSHVPWLRAFGRDEGAHTVGVLRELARDGVFEDVTNEIRKTGASCGACRYFRAPLKGGVEAACLLTDLTEDELALVRARKGHHQPELVAPGVPVREVDVIHLCVGDPEGPGSEPDHRTAVVYFWAPGRVLPPALTVKLG